MFRYTQKILHIFNDIPNRVNLKLVTIDNVNLLENVIQIPNFDASVDGRGNYLCQYMLVAKDAIYSFQTKFTEFH